MELTEWQRARAPIRDSFIGRCDAAGTSATNPDGVTGDDPRVVVADAFCFPTASGVNPMVSIEAIAHLNASRLAARL